jgi:hypothetical protein
MMNDELKSFYLYFIIHRSSFRVLFSSLAFVFLLH